MGILPAPTEFRTLPGYFCLDSRCVVAGSPRLADEVAKFRLLAHTWGASAPTPVRVDFQVHSGFAPEAYSIHAEPSLVVIRAGDAAGAFWATQTLRQLRLAQGHLLACFTCEDSPRFSWRGAMLDSCRHFQSVAFIKKFLDAMALHKLNRFHWHLTDDQAWRLEIPSRPALTGIGSRRRDTRFVHEMWQQGCYTAEEVTQVVEWVLDQYADYTPKDPTVAAKFHTYRLADHLDDVVALLGKVTRVSVVTTGVVETLKKLG